MALTRQTYTQPLIAPVVCDGCGALVMNMGDHDRFHSELEHSETDEQPGQENQP